MTDRVSSTPAAEAGRPLRKDAERNRQRILQAAREVFAERGLEVTLDDIARHAGVGVGTVYRRFPGKEALVEALFEDQADRLLERARQALEDDDPWEGLTGFLTGIAEEFAANRGLREVILSGAHGRDKIAQRRDLLVPALQALVSRAQQAGALRPDIDASDLPLIHHMLGSVGIHTHHVRPEAWRRYLAVILDGLRSRPDLTPLPEPALTHTEMETLMQSPRIGG
ncbi:TetR/AcrR family transcriptional regulator [Spirillospora sp. CA-255316]